MIMTIYFKLSSRAASHNIRPCSQGMEARVYLQRASPPAKDLTNVRNCVLFLTSLHNCSVRSFAQTFNSSYAIRKTRSIGAAV